MKPGLFWILLCIFGVIGLSCNNYDAAQSPQERLAEFSKGSLHSTLNLDAKDLEVVKMDATIGSTDERDGLLVGRASSIQHINGKIYIADLALDALVVADTSDSVIRTIGSEGRGPLEFMDPIQVAFSDKLVAIHEFGERLQILNSDLSFNSFVAGSSGKGNIGISDRYLFGPNNGAESGMITAYVNEMPFKEVRSFMPNIITYGAQPGGYNMYVLATDYRQSDIFVAYKGIPTFYLMDGLASVKAMIELKGLSIDQFENIPLVEIQTKEPQMVKGFWQLFKIISPGLLVFGHLNTAYLVRFENGYFELIKKLRFEDSSGKTLHFSDLSLIGHTIYLASIHEDNLYKSKTKIGKR